MPVPSQNEIKSEPLDEKAKCLLLAKQLGYQPGHWAFYAASGFFQECISGKMWSNADWTGPDGQHCKKLPDWFKDYNAIQKETRNVNYLYWTILHGLVHHPEMPSNHNFDAECLRLMAAATVSQRAEALGIYYKLWKDGRLYDN